MTPHLISIFLDTNILLHFRHISELPFKEIVQAQNIEIILTRFNLTELNANKDNPSQTRLLRERAKKMLDYIESLFPGDKVLGKINDIPVILQVWDANPSQLDLDSNVKDNTLLIDMLQYQKDGHSVCFICNDTGARKCAQVYGIMGIKLSDEYMLSIEDDPIVLENKRLKQEIAELKNRKPKLKLIDAHRQCNDIILSPVSIKLELQPKQQLEYYSNPSYSTHNIDKSFRFAELSSIGINRYIESDLERYNQEVIEYNQNYENYRKKVNICNSLKISRLDIMLINEGTFKASKITVRLFFPDGIKILDNIDCITQVPPPDVPEPPRRVYDITPRYRNTTKLYESLNHKPEPRFDFSLEEIDHRFVFEQEIGYLQHKDQLVLHTLYAVNPPNGFSVSYEIMAEELLSPICGCLQIHHKIPNTADGINTTTHNSNQ